MCFASNGHCLFAPSDCELCKFTISAHYKTLLNDMLGSLFVPRELPEMPRANFFKSLFSVANSTSKAVSGRDELFSESANKTHLQSSSRNKTCSGNTSNISGQGSSGAICSQSGNQTTSNIEKLRSGTTSSFGQELRFAREGLDERGEKLSDVEDRTLQMMNTSENYASAAHQLAQKFKDKKWYQF